MLGYDDEDKSIVLELTYNYGVTEYTKGNAYAQVNLFYLPVIFFPYHLSTLALVLSALVLSPDVLLQVAISTQDVYKSGQAVDLVTKELGGKITRQPGPLPGINTKITSFLDPDGWKTVSPFYLVTKLQLNI